MPIGVRPTRKNSHFSWRAATLKTTGETALVCLPLSDGDVCHGLRRGAGRPSRCRYWRGYPKISHSCCSTLSVIRTSNSPPLSMTMTAPISCLRSPCGNAFALRATGQGPPQAEPPCRSPKPRLPSSEGDWSHVFQDVTWGESDG